MKKWVLLLVILVRVFITEAQNFHFVGLLPSLNATLPVSKKINANLFVSTTIDAFKERFNSVDFPATDMQFYCQPSLIYVHSPKRQYSISYTYQRNNPFNNNFVNEHRLWQQALFIHPLKRGAITNRFRFEERFIQNKVTREFPFSTRLRYQLGFNYPLQGNTIDRHEFYMNVSNDFYVSLTGPKNATFSENWLYAGVGFETGTVGRFELAYLWQSLVRNAQHDMRYLHLMQTTWIVRINTTKHGA